MKLLFTILSFVLLNIAFTQNEGNIWYFGQNGGIDFNSGTAVALGDGAMVTIEGCASICDNNGNLLFYTDGSTVYNTNHQVMLNGIGLMGNSSSTQSAIIVKKPGSANLYYIFTADHFVNSGVNGIRYSIVDMDLQAGLGDVTALNVLVSAPSTEKLTAVKHQNGTDYWVVTANPSQTTFHSFLLTSTGLSAAPVVSSGVSFLCSDFGYLKASSVGDKIATFTDSTLEVFDFDNSTGIASGQYSLPEGGSYGVEFSPSGQYLYVRSLGFTNSNIIQYDLQAGSNNSIANSGIVIGTIAGLAEGAIQRGPDQKIYLASGFGSFPFLSTIENPDIGGLGSNFQFGSFQLSPGTASNIGLPNFHSQAINYLKLDFEICSGESVELSNPSFQNHNWADATAPATVISTDSVLTVAPISTNTYVLYDGLDSIFFNVTVNPVPAVNLGPDINFCNQTSVVIKDPNLVGVDTLSFTWQDGTTADTLIAFTTGQYILTVSNGFCSSSDTIIISNVTGVDINSNNPNCAATPTGSIIANVNNNPNPVTFVISDVAGNIVNTPGTNAANNLLAGLYYVEYADGTGCVGVDSVVLVDPPLILPTISTVDPLCFGKATGSATVSNIINYQGSIDSIFYVWTPNPNGNNGLDETSINGLLAGTHSLEVIDNFGCVNDVIFNIIDPDPLVGEVTSNLPTYCRTAGFQSGNGLVAAQTVPDSSGTGSVNYEWLHLGTGQSAISSTFVIRAPGLVQLTITDVNGCQYIDTVQVDSLNPIADFVVDSPQFLDPLVYEGTEDVNVKITNLSQNFAQANNPNSDTIFQWNLYTNQTPNSSQNWFFTYDLDEKVDTTYGGEEIYNVCLVAKNFNDCKDTICKDVIVHDFPVLAVPNVFTPGSAPNNEFYFPAEGIQDFECTVFNRYGVQVYEFSSISDKWDGSHFKSGNPCSDGVYFYIYKAVSFNGKKFSGEGEVTLIRVK